MGLSLDLTMCGKYLTLNQDIRRKFSSKGLDIEEKLNVMKVKMMPLPRLHPGGAAYPLQASSDHFATASSR